MSSRKKILHMNNPPSIKGVCFFFSTAAVKVKFPLFPTASVIAFSFTACKSLSLASLALAWSSQVHGASRLATRIVNPHSSLAVLRSPAAAWLRATRRASSVRPAASWAPRHTAPSGRGSGSRWRAWSLCCRGRACVCCHRGNCASWSPGRCWCAAAPSCPLLRTWWTGTRRTPGGTLPGTFGLDSSRW